MTTWGRLAQQRPDLTEAGTALLYQFGVGLAFLATTRLDGGPRLHPVCPQLWRGGLYCFVIPSPKRADLLRDGRYALHSFPCPDNEDAFSLTGTAHRVDDADLRADLARQFVEERASQGIPGPRSDQVLFSFDIERCLLTRTNRHGDDNPRHTVWPTA